MKINLYIEVQDSDGFVFFRDVTTDDPSGAQRNARPKWLQTPCRSYCVTFSIPDLAPIYKIENPVVQEIKEGETA